MCYAKPGPRCSGHTRTAYNRAVEKHGADSAEAQEALNAWLRTPEGIKQLRSEGQHELAQQYEQDRAEAIKAYHASKQTKYKTRAEQLNGLAIERAYSLTGRELAVIGAHPDTDPETLTYLAATNNEFARNAVAMNPNTPRITLIALAQSPDHDASYYAASNPALTSEDIDYLRTADRPPLGWQANPNASTEALIEESKATTADVPLVSGYYPSDDPSEEAPPQVPTTGAYLAAVALEDRGVSVEQDYEPDEIRHVRTTVEERSLRGEDLRLKAEADLDGLLAKYTNEEVN